MASHKNYRFFEMDAAVYPAATRHDSPAFELEESDIYDSLSPSLRPRKPAKRVEDTRRDQIPGKTTSSSSLPVNIPDWSKILRGEEYRRKGGVEGDYFNDDEEEGDDNGGWLPPHEFLARTRIASSSSSSFSVHEGVGRTLKGRDLSRVRNAIWAKTGFQD